MARFDRRILDAILDQAEELGSDALGLLEQKLGDLAQDQDDAFLELAIRLSAKLVGEHGPDGIQLARRELNRILDGKETEAFDVTDERTAHLILAAREERELLSRRRVNAIFVRIGDVFGIMAGAAAVRALGSITD